MNDLTTAEQAHVRTAIAFLHRRLGDQEQLAKALGFRGRTIKNIRVSGGTVSPTMAFRVARLVGVSIDSLLAGEYLPAGTCIHCGRGPDGKVISVPGLSQSEAKRDDSPRA